MSSRHQPEAGADSAQALRTFTPPPGYAEYRVLVTDEFGEQWEERVNALGKHDAAHRAVQIAIDTGHYDVTVLEVKA